MNMVISSPLYVYFVIHIRAATYTHSPLESYELVNKRKIKLVRIKCKGNEEGREEWSRRRRRRRRMNGTK